MVVVSRGFTITVLTAATVGKQSTPASVARVDQLTTV